MKMERKGFTLIELLVVIAIIALLISLLLPALGKWRESGRLLVSQINMRELNTANATYATQFADKVASFTWSAGQTPSGEIVGNGILPIPNEDLAAAARQAVNIIRKRTGEDTFPIITGWIPHVLYSHLVIQDFIDQRLPAKLVVSPEDRNRLLWQDTVAFRQNAFAPFQEDGTDQLNWRWSYSSSYQFVPASYSPDVSRPGLDTIGQGGQHNQYTQPTPGTLGKRKASDVRYPSQKVYIFDGQARHRFGQKREYHYTFPTTKQPLQMFDGSNNLVTTNRTTLGGDPTGYSASNPGAWAPIAIEYVPRDWEAPLDGLPNSQRWGRYQWTWGGLKGIDVPNLRPNGEVIVNNGQDQNFRARGPF
jgi:prepilin-type N-terminal cleavage/methylation domain-containing protein